MHDLAYVTCDPTSNYRQISATLCFFTMTSATVKVTGKGSLVAHPQAVGSWVLQTIRVWSFRYPMSNSVNSWWLFFSLPPFFVSLAMLSGFLLLQGASVSPILSIIGINWHTRSLRGSLEWIIALHVCNSYIGLKPIFEVHLYRVRFLRGPLVSRVRPN